MPYYSELLYSFLLEGQYVLLFDPFRNGFLYFMLGGLFLLAIYHTFLYFQNKSSVYLLYAFYLFFIILSQNLHLKSGFLIPIFELMGPFRKYLEFYTELSYILYFFFAFEFLQIQKDFPKWHKAIRRALYVIIIYSVVTFIAYLFHKDFLLNIRLYHFFVIYTLVLSVFMYILFFRSKRKVKYYLIGGSLLLLFFSVSSLIYYQFLIIQKQPLAPAFSLLYFGFISENFLFSLGLGHNQKIILNERNRVQDELIHQLKKNESLEIQLRKEQKGS